MYQNGRNISFTDRSNSSVDMFLRDIRKSQPLSSAEEYELWRLMRQGCQRARNKFIYANLRYVVTIAKKYLVSGTAFEDLLMAGALGITKAVDKFDATLGYRFISYATWYIEDEVRKAAYNNLKQKQSFISYDEPLYADESESETMANALPSSLENFPDWNIQYQEMLYTLKSVLDEKYYQGLGKILEDYISMIEIGQTSSDFTRKYHLSEQQMSHFLEIVYKEGRKIRWNA